MSESSDIYYYNLIVSYFKDNVNFTYTQFCSVKYKSQTLSFKCSSCGRTYYLSKEMIYKAIKDAKSLENVKILKYCERSCYPNDSVTTVCEYCGKQIVKSRREYELRKHHFCSKSCAAKYNNQRRSHYSRSKAKARLKATLDVKYNKQPKRCVVCGHTECIDASLCKKIKRLMKSKCFIKMGFDPSLQGTQQAIDKFYQIRQYVYDLYYNEGLSLVDLQKVFDIKWINTLTRILDILEIPRRSLKESAITYHTKIGTYNNLTEKEIYYRQCQFSFGFRYPQIQGYELIKQYGIFSPNSNINGVSRDHIISISYGWEHNIPPEIISHPANCQIVKHIDNIRKSTRCSITIEELTNRIKLWESGSPLPNVETALP